MDVRKTIFRMVKIQKIPVHRDALRVYLKGLKVVAIFKNGYFTIVEHSHCMYSNGDVFVREYVKLEIEQSHCMYSNMKISREEDKDVVAEQSHYTHRDSLWVCFF